MSVRSIGKIRGNPQLPLAANLHSRNAFTPALDDLVQPERNRLSSVHRTVEFLAGGQPSRVVDFDRLVGLSGSTAADLNVPILQAVGHLGAVAGNFCRGAGVRFLRTAL